jgi:hypothetical protein
MSMGIEEKLRDEVLFWEVQICQRAKNPEAIARNKSAAARVAVLRAAADEIERLRSEIDRLRAEVVRRNSRPLGGSLIEHGIIPECDQAALGKGGGHG